MPMAIFVDTSGWACYLDRRQPFHAEAVTFLQDEWRQLHQVLTTSHVLAELTALLISPLRIPRPDQIGFLASIRNNPFVDVAFIDQRLDSAGWALWEARPDKNWTLVDCTSMSVMQEHQLNTALTTDHHFEQAGFVRLLK